MLMHPAAGGGRGGGGGRLGACTSEKIVKLVALRLLLRSFLVQNSHLHRFFRIAFTDLQPDKCTQATS